MKQILAYILCVSPAGAGLIPLGEHVDVRWRWASAEWTCNAVTYGGVETAWDTRDVFFPLSDKPYSASNPAVSGARFTQPASAAFDFTGVPDGQPLWIAVQGTPGVGECWPGFQNNQSAVFGSYIPSDTRVSQTLARPWIRISLLEYLPPHGTNAHFSLWNTTTGQPPVVWMSSFDNNVINDYHYAEGSHNHLSWGFSSQGVHRIRLRASAFAGPGGTNPTGLSAPFTLTFAVGTFARWQTEHFDAVQLDDPDMFGPYSDPDADGLDNLIEYAFGTDPLHGASVPLADGLGLPLFSLVEDGGTIYQTLTYPRRKAGSRVDPEIYQPLFADSPAGPWSDSGVTTTAAAFPPAQAALNADWELVTSRRPAPPGKIAGFGRVAVTPGD
jgi:surface-anchored protein